MALLYGLFNSEGWIMNWFERHFDLIMPVIVAVVLLAVIIFCVWIVTKPTDPNAEPNCYQVVRQRYYNKELAENERDNAQAFNRLWMKCSRDKSYRGYE